MTALSSKPDRRGNGGDNSATVNFSSSYGQAKSRAKVVFFLFFWVYIASTVVLFGLWIRNTEDLPGTYPDASAN